MFITHDGKKEQQARICEAVEEQYLFTDTYCPVCGGLITADEQREQRDNLVRVNAPVRHIPRKLIIRHVEGIETKCSVCGSRYIENEKSELRVKHGLVTAVVMTGILALSIPLIGMGVAAHQQNKADKVSAQVEYNIEHKLDSLDTVSKDAAVSQAVQPAQKENDTSFQDELNEMYTASASAIKYLLLLVACIAISLAALRAVRNLMMH